MMKRVVLPIVLWAGVLETCHGFVAPRFVGPKIETRRSLSKSNQEGFWGKAKDAFDFVIDPYPSEIPREIKRDIFDAESKTSAGKERQKRILFYGCLTAVMAVLVLINVFITNARQTSIDLGRETLPDIVLKIDSNPISHVVLATGFGGFPAIAIGVTAYFFLDAEYDGQRENAEKIWQEMQRRRAEAQEEKGDKVVKKKKKKKSRSDSFSKKQQEEEQPSKKDAETKRLLYLSEMESDEKEKVVEVAEKQEAPKEDDGLLGKVKGWFKEADNMAVSQALLLNKALEDRGILEKITDETGLKVVGREAAASAKEKDDPQ